LAEVREIAVPAIESVNDRRLLWGQKRKGSERAYVVRSSPNSEHHHTAHVAAYVHAGVLLDVTAEHAGCGSPQASLKLEHFVPAERKAFRYSFRARMRVKFSQQGLDVEFHGVQRYVQTARYGLIA
jgi:hypothetical protein